jgi:hypothetical protein
MLHYSCDFCKRPIDTATDVRHVVKIEVFQAVEESCEDGCCDGAARGEDVEHLEEMQDLLDRAAAGLRDVLARSEVCQT